jgi:hypothetical protein
MASNSSDCPWDFNRLSKSFKAFPPQGVAVTSYP